MTNTNNDNDRIISKLMKLGGRATTDDSLVFEGTKFVMPESMTVDKGIQFLRNWKEQNEQEFDISRVYEYKAWDGAAAFDRAVRSLTGMGGFGKTQRSFFGENRPEYRTIEINAEGDTMQVPWGFFQIPMLQATVTMNSDNRGRFILAVTAPRKNRAAIEGFFKLVQKELEENSIYRGRAIDGAVMPNFINVEAVDFDKVVYSDEVQTQLEANVWGAILHAEQLEELGVSLKRAVLFEGDYGTGKTLAAFRTAKVAVDEGWTFVYCRPGEDNYQEALETAKLYQPSVVFFEDIDTVSDSSQSNNTKISALLDSFDGIQAKGTRMLAVMTTNHADRIHKGMVRPGRLDAIIHIGALDRHGIETLIRKSVPTERLDRNVNFSLVYEQMQGFVPAFAKEAIDRAIRYALARTDGNIKFSLTTEDLCAAAIGLQPQLKLMQEAGEGERLPNIDNALREMLTNVAVLSQHEPDGMAPIVRND